MRRSTFALLALLVLVPTALASVSLDNQDGVVVRTYKPGENIQVDVTHGTQNFRRTWQFCTSDGVCTGNNENVVTGTYNAATKGFDYSERIRVPEVREAAYTSFTWTSEAGDASARITSDGGTDLRATASQPLVLAGIVVAVLAVVGVAVVVLRRSRQVPRA